MEKKYNEDFLVRWLAGKLHKDELTGFEESQFYRQIMVIEKEVKSLRGPKIDTQLAIAKVKSENRKPKSETRIKRLWLLPALAASLIILIGMYGYFFGTKVYSTGIGEKESVLLADGSAIELNANSRLVHKRFGWLDNRKVEFEGEAFFDIEHGADFVVETKKGTVTVLGTRFNIKDRKKLTIQCYSGRIVFLPKGNHSGSTELTKGMEMGMTGKQVYLNEFSGSDPEWRKGFSSFNLQPFTDVLEELTHQFPVRFRIDSVRTARLFTGKFSHKNLEHALEVTMGPMGIKYNISADKRIVTLSE